jgi:hypothetical protein
MTVKVSFSGFWPGFDKDNNFFKKALDGYFHKETVISSDDHSSSDFVFYSVFGRIEGINTGDAKKIFFTGESRRDFFQDGDIYLGFDPTNVDSKIFRLPLWMLYIDWWSGTDVQKIDSLTQRQNPQSTLSREQACCIVASNPVSHRMEVAQSLVDVFPVHGYGLAFSSSPYNGDKKELLQNYIFNICFENTLSRGYVTEKLFEAKFSGCIPIYWGDEWSKHDFNEQCFIYYNNYESKYSFIEDIKRIWSSKQAMEELSSEPLFTKKPSLEGLYTFFDDIKLKG